jgi:hypothetical protein
MTRDQLEHLIRAAAVIVGDDEIVVIGSVSASCPLFIRRSVTTLRGSPRRPLACPKVGRIAWPPSRTKTRAWRPWISIQRSGRGFVRGSGEPLVDSCREVVISPDRASLPAGPVPSKRAKLQRQVVKQSRSRNR